MQVKYFKIQYTVPVKIISPFDFGKINKKFENHHVFYQILLYFMYNVHLLPDLYCKILSAFDELRQKLCSKNLKMI